MSKKKTQSKSSFLIPSRLVGALADEVAKTVVSRLPYMLTRSRRPKNQNGKNLEGALFFDTSAIIDGRIFEVIRLGLLNDVYVVPEEILLELKHIADSQDTVKRERGRKGLEFLDDLKKRKGARLIIKASEPIKESKSREVDERLIQAAKTYKGKIITCDYNLEKKASIEGVLAINVNALAQVLKVTAVPGEAIHIKIMHLGKDITQGVGYLDDGTMIVVEQASGDLNNTVDVVVSRVLQTSAGRILFAKKI